MDTRKVTLVATIAIIALLAIGIGYAYTATTSNSGNNASPEYITLVQGETGAYTFAPTDAQGKNQHVYWDSADARVGTSPNYTYTMTYTLTQSLENLTYAPLKDYKIVKIGNEFSLIPSITIQNGTTNANLASPLTGTIDASGIIAPFSGQSGNEAAVFIVVETVGHENAREIFKICYQDSAANPKINTIQKYNATEGKFVDDNTFSIFKHATDVSYLSATVNVYYGYNGTTGIVVPHNLGLPPTDGPKDNPVDNAALSFKLYNSGYNGTVIPAQSVVITEDGLAVNVGASGTFTATVKGANNANATNQNIVCASSDPSVATAIVSAEKTVKVYGLKAGTATIKVISIDGKYTDTIEITVNNP